MQPPIESRMLLKAAALLVPLARREDWRREWEAEVWWWMGSHAGGRGQLAWHCAGALCDAAYLRATETELFPALQRLAGSPSVCLGVLAAAILAVAGVSGLRETRRAVESERNGGTRVVVLSQVLPFMGAHLGVPPSKVADWDARAASIEGAAVYAVSRDGQTAYAGEKFFALLGTRAALGRLDQAGVVVSFERWRREFRGDRSLVGREIAGVLPEDFRYLDLHPAVWMIGPPRNDAPSKAIARLKRGVSAGQAQEELRRLAAEVKPVSRGSMVVAEPLDGLTSRPLALAIPWLALACCAGIAAFVRFRQAPKFAAFLAAKCALALTLVLAATVEFGSAWLTIHSSETNLAAGAASLWLFLAGPAAVLYWCERDQGRRCRTCLHRLAMPVQFGSGARILLERAGTELICPHGHGTLFTADDAGRTAQWDPMDSSWRELFVK